MSKEGKIAAATGISVMGRGPVAMAAHNAMVSAALAAHSAGHDDDKVKAAIVKARADVKKPAENA
jgi:hypothetical protein